MGTPRKQREPDWLRRRMKMAAIQERSLRDLLDSFVTAQKQDIHAFSGGHLNEANLWKPQGEAAHKSWQSAKKKGIQLVPPSKLPKSSRQTTQYQDGMKETLMKFSMGTTGSLPPVQKQKRTPPKGTKGPVVVDKKRASPGDYTKTDDGVLVEELRLPESLLLTPRQVKSKAWAKEDLATPHDDIKSPAQSTIKDNNLARLQKRFLPSYHDAVTKKDQYIKFQQFQTDVLRTKETMEQNVFSGVKAVEHLEKKLQEDLDSLEYNGYGPNFHRLQVYSNTFDDLILESPTFGYILRQIKDEYDQYVSSLLDTQTARHQLLYTQVEQLASHSASNPSLLQGQTQRVTGLEAQARQVLQLNERLRQELQEEKELANQPDTEPLPKGKVFSEEPPLELTDQIEEVRATILEKLDDMAILRGKLRNEFVPSTVCTHLEQCIKETEVEIQKLTTQKEYFERSIAEMEHDLRVAIATADTTDKDAKRVWRKVSAVKRLHGSLAGQKGVEFTMNSDDEEEDESKWDWYIS